MGDEASSLALTQRYTYGKVSKFGGKLSQLEIHQPVKYLLHNRLKENILMHPAVLNFVLDSAQKGFSLTVQAYIRKFCLGEGEEGEGKDH